MTRAMRITFIVAAVLGFASGTVWGCYKAKEASSSMRSAAVISIPSATSDFALQQFEYADRVHARQAVLLEIRILEQLERAAHDSNVEGKLGYAYARLPMIEEATGETEAGRRALDQAKGWLRQAHPGAELTDEEIKNNLNLMDDASNRL